MKLKLNRDLIEAAQSNNSVGVTAALKDNGADINYQDEKGDTALHIALRNRDLKTIAYLKKHDADYNIKNKKGETPYDILNNYKQLVKENKSTKQQISQEKHKEVQTKKIEKEPKKIASTDKKTIELQNEAFQKAKTLPKVKLKSSDNKLLQAAKDRDLSKLIEALKEGADINAQDENGDTSLHMALTQINRNIVAYLKSQDVDYNIPNKQGKTPQHILDEYKQIVKENRQPREISLQKKLKEDSEVIKTQTANKTSINTSETALVTKSKLQPVKIEQKVNEATLKAKSNDKSLFQEKNKPKFSKEEQAAQEKLVQMKQLIQILDNPELDTTKKDEISKILKKHISENYTKPLDIKSKVSSTDQEIFKLIFQYFPLQKLPAIPGSTFFHESARKGDKEIFDILWSKWLTSNGDADYIKASDGSYPLEAAVDFGKDMVEYVVAKFKESYMLQPALKKALRVKDIDSFEILYRNGAKLDDMALIEVAQHGSLGIIKYLDVCYKPFNNTKYYQEAIKENSQEVAEYFKNSITLTEGIVEMGNISHYE